MLSVGNLKPNDLGLFDMLGNASQWCEDRFEYYSAGKDKDDVRDMNDINKDKARVLRGGLFFIQAAFARSASRVSNVPTHGSNNYGFRTARTFR
jgi:formylglycine-generating enzyme required for sulfatase activity